MRSRIVHGVAVVALAAASVAIGRLNTAPSQPSADVAYPLPAPTVTAVASDADRADRADRASRSTRRPVAALAPGAVGRVTRRTTRREVGLERVPFKTVRRNDATRYAGTTFVASVGRPGLRMTRTDVHSVNGRVVRRMKLPAQLVLRARPHVVLVGTKPRPKPQPKPEPKPVVVTAPVPKPARVATAPPPAPRPVVRTATADGLNWAALAQCESGGDPRVVSAGGSYRGLYQFSMTTWRGVGGSGDPIDASRSEQTYRAQVLYRRAGADEWPHCGSRLFS
ncbi:MAG TPA: resuscitation-promoting factor [Mycobacteriales bacterium]|nr:resuscitation-promoting factor [Mycobacteriales bacterium]